MKPLRPSADGAEPDTMRGVLRNVLPIQKPKQIAQPRESDQAFVSQNGARDAAGDKNR